MKPTTASTNVGVANTNAIATEAPTSNVPPSGQGVQITKPAFRKWNLLTSDVAVEDIRNRRTGNKWQVVKEEGGTSTDDQAGGTKALSRSGAPTSSKSTSVVDENPNKRFFKRTNSVFSARTPHAAAKKAANRGHEIIFLQLVGTKGEGIVHVYEGSKRLLNPHEITAHSQKIGAKHKALVKKICTIKIVTAKELKAKRRLEKQKERSALQKAREKEKQIRLRSKLQQQRQRQRQRQRQQQQKTAATGRKSQKQSQKHVTSPPTQSTSNLLTSSLEPIKKEPQLLGQIMTEGPEEGRPPSSATNPRGRPRGRQTKNQGVSMTKGGSGAGNSEKQQPQQIAQTNKGKKKAPEKKSSAKKEEVPFKSEAAASSPLAAAPSSGKKRTASTTVASSTHLESSTTAGGLQQQAPPKKRSRRTKQPPAAALPSTAAPLSDSVGAQ